MKKVVPGSTRYECTATFSWCEPNSGFAGQYEKGRIYMIQSQRKRRDRHFMAHFRPAT